MKRSKLKYSPIESDCVIVTSMPSYFSHSSSDLNGSATCVALTDPSAGQTATFVTLTSCVLPKDSTAVPWTRTTSPASTGLPLATNRPFDVFGSASTSASASWTKKPPRPSEPWKSPTTTPSMTNWEPA